MDEDMTDDQMTTRGIEPFSFVIELRNTACGHGTGLKEWR